MTPSLLACIVPAAVGLACTSLPVAAQTASAELKDIDGRDVGKATLIETPEGVLIRLSIKAYLREFWHSTFTPLASASHRF